MKKLIFALFTLASVSGVFGQAGWLTTNFIYTTVSGGHASLVGLTNYWRLVTPSNAVVEVDTITAQLQDVPTTGWTNGNSFVFRLYDNWVPTNRFCIGGTTASNNYTVATITQYPTNWIEVDCPPSTTDPGVAGGTANKTNFMTSGVYTNWYTNTLIHTLSSSVTYTNMFTPLTPVIEWIQYPSTTVTKTGLGKILTKGALIGWEKPSEAASGRVETNNVYMTLRYRVLFSPSRP